MSRVGNSRKKADIADAGDSQTRRIAPWVLSVELVVQLYLLAGEEVSDGCMAADCRRSRAWWREEHGMVMI